jgi:hypothetical protein
MKNILFILLLFGSIPLVAQKPVSKQELDKAIAEKGAKLVLYADKDLLEANESCVLSVRVVIPPAKNSDGQPEGMGTDILLPEGEVNPYKVTNWRVVEGGGNLITESIAASYSAPGKAPEKRVMVISVDCEPLSPNLPKVQLLKTLYFSENETAIVLNIPAMGIVNAKFVNKIAGGVKLPNVPANVKLPPDVQANLVRAQQEMAKAQQASGYNLNALTSNASAIYDPAQNLTAIHFSQLGLEAMDGGLQIVTQMAILGIAYKGKGTGTFSLADEKIGLGFAIPSSQQAFGCSKDAKGIHDERLPCTGGVTITKDDGKIMQGYFSTKVYTGVDKQIISGSIYGKFTVMKAN